MPNDERLDPVHQQVSDDYRELAQRVAEDRREIREELDKIRGREARYATIGNGIVGFMAVALLGFNVFNSTQVSSALTRAEDTILKLEEDAEKAFGQALVKRARVEAVGPDPSRILLLPYVETRFDRTFDRERVALALWTYYEVRVEGGIGEVAGAEFRFDGTIREVLPRLQNGVANERVLSSIYADWVTRPLREDVTGNRGFSIVPEGRTRHFQESFWGYLDSCAEVETLLRTLTDDGGTVEMRPIILNLDGSPDISRFGIDLDLSSYNGCSEPVPREALQISPSEKVKR